ncbi:alpha/beta hydrolase [Sphingobacterium sp. DN00404]|uniref:Alpha/beta hydrolase n=1 Tax=Sphingobacterium micropteri TaxID=2763501 RepID=A0ABR7YP55_9SPHI|nr:alpha/beta hydrolase [Sphingobacterium micropteri]MBD1433109.1 alpha/beta hydrolase [Sphingobacterium micropteri]
MMDTRKIVIFLLLIPTLVFAQQVPIPEGWSAGYVYANNVRLHYYHATPQPDKPVIVMVHGVTDNGLCWTTLTQQFEDSYDIYMLDARGHGLSDPFQAGDDGETLIKDVVAFVKAMELDKPILLGHSMGAATVMRLAADYPDLGKAVIMLDPLLGPRMTRPVAPSRHAESKSNSSAVPISTKRTSPKVQVNMFGAPEVLVRQNNYSMDELMKLGSRQNPQWHETDIMYWALSKKQYHGPYTEQAAQAMSGTMDVGNALARVSIPALILKADATEDVRQKNEKIAREMKRGKLIHIEGGGHNLHHDRLMPTAEAIKEFLAGFLSVHE